MDLKKHLSLEKIIESPNLVELMSKDDVKKLGQEIYQNYSNDKLTRATWEQTYADGMRLVMQLIEEKTTPWSGASNVKFPLMTISTLQYHAKAYPALVRGTRPVNCRVIGEDPTGEKSKRAKRVSEHMSFQVLEEDPNWEEQMDKALIVQALNGCAFKKTYFDSSRKYVVSELVLPKDLVINYWAKSLETVSRLTHVLYFSQNDIEERKRRGLYASSSARFDGLNDQELSVQAKPVSDVIEDAEDEIAGVTQGAVDEDTPIKVLEHHFYLDLDGDGYREPYIGFVREDTRELMRLVARFEKDKIEKKEDGTVIRIEPERYFTKFSFIPSPDGSIYDMGFLMLLGSTNDIINTCFNQLLDAATLNNLGGGFLARGIRMKGGEQGFRPGEWKRTDSNPADLQNGIKMLPTKEPSTVMFQLLDLMINVGRQIGMATDAAVGENPGQNQKVGTTEAVIAQGEKVFNGIYKRTYRALRDEFRLIYRANYLRAPLSAEFDYASDGNGEGGKAFWRDYIESDKSVVPSADPTIASQEQIIKRDMMVRQLSKSTPGYIHYEVERRILENMEIPAIDKIYPAPGSPNAQPMPTPPNVQIAQIKMQIEQAKIQARDRQHQLELMENARLNQAKISKLEAETQSLIQEGMLNQDQKFKEMHDMELNAAKQYQDQIMQSIEGYSKILEQSQKPQGVANGNEQKPVGRMDANGGNKGIPQVPQGVN